MVRCDKAVHSLGVRLVVTLAFTGEFPAVAALVIMAGVARFARVRRNTGRFYSRSLSRNVSRCSLKGSGF